ncbi:hypothetical protein [Clostridium psychrophilum]|nr:hypothetical protein [Clostridium psychrophilum]
MKLKMSKTTFRDRFLKWGMKNIVVTRSNRKVPNLILEVELRCI